MKLPKTGLNKFIVAGLVLFVLSGLAYFGVLPVLGYTVDFSKPHLSVNFGRGVAYLKIAVNGQTLIEENIGFNFIANRVVNVDAGDTVEVRFRWEQGYSGYIRVRIAKLPSSSLEPNCIEILEVSGQGPPGLKHDVIMWVDNVIVNPDGTRTEYQSDYVYIDLPDAPSPGPTPEPTTTITTPTITTTTTPPKPTTTITTPIRPTSPTTTTTTATATITSIIATTTVSGTVTMTVTTTTTTTITATMTTVEANTYAPNRVVALVLGIAGAFSMILGFRRIP